MSARSSSSSSGGSSGSRRSKRRTVKTTSKKSQKDYSVILGISLVVFGLGMSLYSFDVIHSVKDVFAFPDFSNLLGLWPIFIVLIGFFFLLKDAFKKTDSKSWDSKR